MGKLSMENNEASGSSSSVDSNMLGSKMHPYLRNLMVLGLSFRVDPECWMCPTKPVKDITPAPPPSVAMAKVTDKKKTNKKSLGTIYEEGSPEPANGDDDGALALSETGLGLSLNTDGVLKAWCGRGSAFADGNGPDLPLSPTHVVGRVLPAPWPLPTLVVVTEGAATSQRMSVAIPLEQSITPVLQDFMNLNIFYLPVYYYGVLREVTGEKIFLSLALIYQEFDAPIAATTASGEQVALHHGFFMENGEPTKTDQMEHNDGHTPLTNISNTITIADENGLKSLGPNVDAKERKRQRERERYAAMPIEKTRKVESVVKFNTSYLVLQAMAMWGNDRRMKFVGDAKILQINFVIDLLSYEDNSCRYAIPTNIQQRLIDIAKKD
ncbi:Putative RNA-binding protein [Zea mays]|uniref:Putative RNA-binding protein n=1 Tax=Zea mays TaxID=4577 RepID=A0A1D6LUP4_MAIZE|nr:Putative RNA-binding protein [Zea mays]